MGILASYYVKLRHVASDRVIGCERLLLNLVNRTPIHPCRYRYYLELETMLAHAQDKLNRQLVEFFVFVAALGQFVRVEAGLLQLLGGSLTVAAAQ